MVHRNEREKESKSESESESESERRTERERERERTPMKILNYYERHPKHREMKNHKFRNAVNKRFYDINISLGRSPRFTPYSTSQLSPNDAANGAMIMTP